MSKNELSEVDITDEGGRFVPRPAGPLPEHWPSECAAARVASPQLEPGPPRRAGRPAEPRSLDEDAAGGEPRAARCSIVDCLLVELYETYSATGRRNADSWDSSTEASGSDAFLGRSNSGSSFLQELQQKHTRRHQMSYLAQKAPEELHSIVQEVRYRIGLQSAKLIRQLRRRDRLGHKLQKNYDIITACLQAVSQKRREAARRNA